MSAPLQYPAGSAIALTTGEYSDYALRAVLITLKPLDMPTIARVFRYWLESIDFFARSDMHARNSVSSTS